MAVVGGTVAIIGFVTLSGGSLIAIQGFASLGNIGGTVAIIGFVTLSGGSLIAIQGFASLGNIGVEAFTGFFAALANTRIAAPIVAGVTLAATVGAGATAQLGAMRISEEIDALEVMGIKSISFLVSTRILGGLAVIVPLYALALDMAFTSGQVGAMRISEEIDALEVMGIKSISFLVSTRILGGLAVIVPLYALALDMAFTSGQVVTTVFYGQSNGTYEHYFRTFLRPEDVGWSVFEVVIIAVVVMITHCYYGYTASGGPVGVGHAVGRSMRFSLVSVVVVVLLAQLALYGVDPNFNLTV
ncbi:ABC transporter permease [Mycobacterium avium]|uniref:ABC transporter permease n=2 Tax=Mycobacterium avium TaxID=1764 RepID=UPI001E30F21F|nr:ABC transporter permease [Mycobacterium avium]